MTIVLLFSSVQFSIYSVQFNNSINVAHFINYETTSKAAPQKTIIIQLNPVQVLIKSIIFLYMNCLLNPESKFQSYENICFALTYHVLQQQNPKSMQCYTIIYETLIIKGTQIAMYLKSIPFFSEICPVFSSDVLESVWLTTPFTICANRPLQKSSVRWQT